MTTHTPTPWVFEHREGSGKRSRKRILNDSEWGRIGFWGSNHSFVLGSAESWDGDFDQPSDEDVDFILNAVNNHYELLEALKNLLAVMEGEGGTKPNAQETARQVIAKAEGV
jgi:hypothetical protein